MKTRAVVVSNSGGLAVVSSKAQAEGHILVVSWCKIVNPFPER